MRAYREHSGKAVETDARFKHVMALALDPSSDHTEGVVRCITSREGDVAVWGFTDYSILCKVRGDLEQYEIGEPLHIRNQEEIVHRLTDDGLDFLGLEDPDIWTDGNGLTHLYFTMPFISRDRATRHSRIHLGHAVGKDLNSLVMTMPVLEAPRDFYPNACAKEVSIAPLNSRRFRYNLFESHDKQQEEEETCSTIRVAIVKDMSGPWEFGPTIFHPAEHNLPWIGGHSSPGPLLPRSFINIGDGKLVSIINGREANRHENGKILYSTFSVGLMVYNYENGSIDWASSEPLIRDSEARTITFASQFIETKNGEGVLYAHVDDSFVRAYTLYAQGITGLLP